MKTKRHFSKGIKIMVVALALVGVVMQPQTANAAPSAQVREAQSIMTKFGLPTGPIDGWMGPKTQRGLCAFRYISGMTVSRSSTINSTLMNKLRQYDNQYNSLEQMPARKNMNREHMVAQKTCQVMFHAMNGKFTKAMAMSTGVKGVASNGDEMIETPNEPRYSDQSYYTLGGTNRGWHCSSSFPESCRTETAGRFSYISDFGNMYNIRWMHDGGLYVHGSMRVPTYPGSAGCIRVSTADSDWMWDHVGNNGTIRLYVEGSYNWNH